MARSQTGTDAGEKAAKALERWLRDQGSDVVVVRPGDEHDRLKKGVTSPGKTTKGPSVAAATAYVILGERENPIALREVLAEAVQLSREAGPSVALDSLRSTRRKVAAGRIMPRYHRGSGLSVATAAADGPDEEYRAREAQRWLEIRKEFLATYESVGAPELGRLTGSRSINPSSRAQDWLRAGRIFGVNDGSSVRFPLFQIDLVEGRPWPEVKDVLSFLGRRLSEWQIAIWFTSPNALTGDWRRPVDLLGKESLRLIEAAEGEVVEKVY